MNFIPIIFVWGHYNRTKPLQKANNCPNCGQQQGAQLYETYNRCHFCFVPLFKSTGKRR